MQGNMLNRACIPKIKLFCNLYSSKMRSEFFSLALNIHTQCTNAKGAKLRPLEVFSFCHIYLALLKDASLQNAGLKHSRSNLVFEIRNIFSECSITFRNFGLVPNSTRANSRTYSIIFQFLSSSYSIVALPL